MIFNYSPGQLTQNVNLMLTFTAPTKDKLSTLQNLVAWKVITMRSVPGSKATNKAPVSYTGRLAFGSSQNAIILQCLTATFKLTADALGHWKRHLRRLDCRDEGKCPLVNLGESIDLNWQDDAAVWGLPSNSVDIGTLIKAKNTTPYRQNISVGTLQTIGTVDVYSPSFMWKVGSKLSATADFHPMLKSYVNLGYVQNEFITADISSDLLQEWNLTGLPAVSNWLFSELPQVLPSGGYSITPMATLTMAKEIESKPYEDLNLSFACRLNWHETVPRQVVQAVFAHISSTLAAKGLNYHEEHNDKESNHKCNVGQKGETCENLSTILKQTIVEALEKEASTINRKALTIADLNFYWTIMDKCGMNVGGGDELEIISQGSVAWFLLK
ncbi:hypothetical protein B0H13DRAFT_2315306 [Mycena leptocephala]|nr:hypothetical protein B0H13DRAFT_2315306 [Mycena leptocephala]